MISQNARLRARLNRGEAEHPCSGLDLRFVPSGLRPRGFAVFGAEAFFNKIFTEKIFGAVPGVAGGVYPFWAGMARHWRAFPAFLSLVNRFIIHSQKNG